MGLDPISETVGAVTSVADTFLGERISLKNQHEAQDFSAQQYDTRYQRQVADLKAAGLNPMLAYTNGAPAGPQSSGASAPRSDITGSVNTTRIASAQEANINQDTEKKSAETDNILTDTFVKSNMPEKIQAETKQALQSASTAAALADNYREQITKMDQEINTLITQSQKNKADTNLSNQIANGQQYLNGLRIAEKILTEASTSNKWQEYNIALPKERAAATWSAEAGERAKNMWNIFSPFK